MFEHMFGVAPSVATAVSLDQWQGVSDTTGLIGLTTRPPVQDSEDVQRVAALPRRPQIDLGPWSAKAQALVEIMNERLRRPDWQRAKCKCAEIAPERAVDGRRPCILSLLPAQAWALYEAPLVGGMIGAVATGSGKTGMGILMPMVMPNCKLAVGLVPSNLVEQLALEYRLWREHWRVPRLVYGDSKSELQDAYPNAGPRPTLHIVPYSKLSRPSATTLLKGLNPDLLFADEMDNLSNLQSARTGRFVRAFAEVPNTRFCGWTGTPWDRSIMEVVHLSAFALKRGSPLPLDPHVARGWALALDPSDRPASAGALRKFCNEPETLIEGFHRRLIETPGVIATTEGAIGIPLHIYERDVGQVPPAIVDMLDQVRGFKRPDGEELVDPMEVARVACEVALGFYYRWVFPREERGQDGKLTNAARARIDIWFERRKSWRQELRKKLAHRAEYLDSEKLCTDAAQRFYAGYVGELPTWEAESYLAWREVEDTVYHETEAVWVDDFIAQDAADWAAKYRGVVWYKHDTFGKRVAELSGLPVHGGGPDAEQLIRAERGDRSIIASIKSHGRGRDGLQYIFHNQYIPAFPSSGKMTEQLLARLHRPGQTKTSVHTWVLQHVDELRNAFEQACSRAVFATTWGTNQKVLESHCDWRDDDV